MTTSPYQTELNEQLPCFNRDSQMNSERKEQRDHNSFRSRMIFLKVKKEAWDASTEPIQTDAKGIRSRLVTYQRKKRRDPKTKEVIPAREVQAIINDPVQEAIKEGLIKSTDGISNWNGLIPQSYQSKGGDPIMELKAKAKKIQHLFTALRSRSPAEWEGAIRGLGMEADTILIARLVKLIWWDFVIWWEEDFSPEFTTLVNSWLKPDDYQQHDKKTLAMFLWKLGYPAYFAHARTISL